MFEQVSLSIINDQIKFNNAFMNAITVSYQLEEGKYDKQMSRAFSNPSIIFIDLSYHLSKQIKDIDNYLLNIYEQNETAPLIVKCFLFSEIRRERKDNLYQKFHIEDETQEKIEDILKSSFKSIKLDNILNDDCNILHFGSFYKEFNVSTQSLSQELKIFMFVNDENFFKIIEKIKYSQILLNGNEYLINKNILEELNCLKETIDYIDKIDKNKLSKENEELLSIWNKKTGW
jgi:hypothetical protein